MTVQEYYACARDLLVAVQAMRRVKARMGDFAVHVQHATWDCLDAIIRELWEGFDATHPEEHNPFGGPDWNDPPAHNRTLAPPPPEAP